MEIATCHSAMNYFVKKGKIDEEMSSFPRTGRSTNSIALNRWLLLNKWMLQWKLRWWGYKLVGCCKLSWYENESCDEHAVYFWRWLKWRAMFITFSLSSNDFKSPETKWLPRDKGLFWRFRCLGSPTRVKNAVRMRAFPASGANLSVSPPIEIIRDTKTN